MCKDYSVYCSVVWFMFQMFVFYFYLGRQNQDVYVGEDYDSYYFVFCGQGGVFFVKEFID